MDEEKTIAIIQARMGSTRLPNKVLEDLAGKPMLWHLVNRLSFSGRLDGWVVATTVDPRDDRIADFCLKEGIPLFRGQEDDVLDRYYQAARGCLAGIVVRITADCPLIDPALVDAVIALREREGADYASNVNPPTFPDGLDVEVMTFGSLRRAWEEAALTYQREHVTSYITEHPELFRTANLAAATDRSSWRLTVDEREDLETVRRVFEALHRAGEVFGLAEIEALVSRDPEILALNRRYRRNETYTTGE